MSAIFADTSYWIAFTNVQDCAYERANGPRMLDFWLDTYQVSRKKLWKTRYGGSGTAVIQTDEQMLLAQECTVNLRRILLEARKVHSRQDYSRMAEPILLEIQRREQDILEYLGEGLGAATS